MRLTAALKVSLSESGVDNHKKRKKIAEGNVVYNINNNIKDFPEILVVENGIWRLPF